MIRLEAIGYNVPSWAQAAGVGHPFSAGVVGNAGQSNAVPGLVRILGFQPVAKSKARQIPSLFCHRVLCQVLLQCGPLSDGGWYHRRRSRNVSCVDFPRRFGLPGRDPPFCRPCGLWRLQAAPPPGACRPRKIRLTRHARPDRLMYGDAGRYNRRRSSHSNSAGVLDRRHEASVFARR